MRNFSELNINEGGHPVMRPPPTKEQIYRFEDEFHVRLPETYISLLNHANGGHPEIDAFQPKGAREPGLCGISRFYFLNDDRENLSGVWRATKAYLPHVSGNVIAIANDGGGNQIFLCFDDDPPSVKMGFHEEGMRLILVADSFEEFIDMLCVDPDMV